YTIVLDGTLVVEDDEGSFEVAAGQAVIAPAGQRVRYRTPRGAEYIAVCLPAFSPDIVRREGPGRGGLCGFDAPRRSRHPRAMPAQTAPTTGASPRSAMDAGERYTANLAERTRAVEAMERRDRAYSMVRLA